MLILPEVKDVLVPILKAMIYSPDGDADCRLPEFLDALHEVLSCAASDDLAGVDTEDVNNLTSFIYDKFVGGGH